MIYSDWYKGSQPPQHAGWYTVRRWQPDNKRHGEPFKAYWLGDKWDKIGKLSAHDEWCGLTSPTAINDQLELLAEYVMAWKANTPMPEAVRLSLEKLGPRVLGSMLTTLVRYAQLRSADASSPIAVFHTSAEGEAATRLTGQELDSTLDHTRRKAARRST